MRKHWVLETERPLPGVRKTFILWMNGCRIAAVGVHHDDKAIAVYSEVGQHRPSTPIFEDAEQAFNHVEEKYRMGYIRPIQDSRVPNPLRNINGSSH